MSDAGLGERRAALLDAIAERLVPVDEHGAGAREARATRYLRRALEGDLRDRLGAYEAGLDAVDERARADHGRGFRALAPHQQDALLACVERDDPAFFGLVRRHVLEGMFGDPDWGGNAGGCGWRLLGYPGPRLVWTEADQRIVDER